MPIVTETVVAPLVDLEENTETGELKEQVSLLETELEAARAALALEEAEADGYANLMHEADKAVRYLYELAIGKDAGVIATAGEEIGEFISKSLSRTTIKGGGQTQAL